MNNNLSESKVRQLTIIRHCIDLLIEELTNIENITPGFADELLGAVLLNWLSVAVEDVENKDEKTLLRLQKVALDVCQKHIENHTKTIGDWAES